MKYLKLLAISLVMSAALLPAPLQAAPQPVQLALQAPVQAPVLSFAQATAPQTTLFGLPLNMGPVDRLLRGVLAVGLVGTGIYSLSTQGFGANSNTLGWTLIGVATIPTATAATGYCPLYQVFGLEYSF